MRVANFEMGTVGFKDWLPFSVEIDIETREVFGLNGNRGEKNG